MLYNFSKPISRKGTYSIKHDLIAKEYGDDNIIGMRIADTDFAPPPSFFQAMESALQQQVIGYSYPGDQVYENIHSFYKRRTGLEIDPSCVEFSSPGLLPIVSLAVQLHSAKGDHIATFHPGYPPLSAAVTANKRKLIPIALDYNKKTGDYTINWETLEKSLTPKTKIFIFCNPHNPLGRVWSREELQRVADICLQRGIVVISDEIHGFLNFPEKPYIPMASLSDEVAQNTISCFAPSKLFDVPGVFAGFSVIFNPKWKKEYADALVGSGMAFARRNLFILKTIEACYSDQNDEWIEQKIAYIQKNSQFVDEYLAKHLPKIVPSPVGASFLRWLNFQDYKMDEDKLEDHLIKKAKVALTRGSDFGEAGRGFCRMNIGCTEKTLEDALERLRKSFS